MSDRRHRGPLTWRLHPIWRGIGFLLLILIPIISFSVSEMTLDFFLAQKFEFPREGAQLIQGVDNFYVQLGITFVLTLLLYLVMSVISSLIYTLSGGRENEEIVSRIGSHRRRY